MTGRLFSLISARAGRGLPLMDDVTTKAEDSLTLSRWEDHLSICPDSSVQATDHD